MRKYSLLTLFILSVCSYVSCTCRGTIQCGNGSLGLRTVGFSITDIDSMLMISYRPDNNFDSVIDTQRMYPDNGGYGLNHDTCFLDWAAQSGNDYKIIFPTAGLTYTITELKVAGPTSEEITYKCEEGTPVGSGFCTRNIVSFAVDGQPYSSDIYTIIK